jgi:hypothetical protein
MLKIHSCIHVQVSSKWYSASLSLPKSRYPNQTVGMFLFLVCNDCVFFDDY